jgi:hypothetical protein
MPWVALGSEQRRSDALLGLFNLVTRMTFSCFYALARKLLHE